MTLLQPPIACYAHSCQAARICRLPVRPSPPLLLLLPPCSDVMSKQMKAIRNGRQSQQLPRPPPTAPAFGKQTKLLATNKSSRPFKLRSKRASLPPAPSQTMRGIKNYLQQLPSSSTLLKRDSSRQQQQQQRQLQRGVDFSIRLSAALIFPWKFCRGEAQLRPRHAVIRLNENPNVNGRMCKHTSVSPSLPMSLLLSLCENMENYASRSRGSCVTVSWLEKPEGKLCLAADCGTCL